MRKSWSVYESKLSNKEKKCCSHAWLGQNQNEKDCSKISLHFVKVIHCHRIGLTCYCPLCFVRFQPGPRMVEWYMSPKLLCRENDVCVPQKIEKKIDVCVSMSFTHWTTRQYSYPPNPGLSKRLKLIIM